ncbi:MAG: hypothetical protein KGI60_03320 [Patescibacteria group bacterium]|nr:hypothetical protein [Patescibacteria group bacterium]
MLQDFIKEKAREISYALIRVAFYIKRSDLRSRIESLAFELLDDAAKASVENTQQSVMAVLSSISSLDALVRLAHSIYEIEPVNATILVRELNELNTAMRQYGKLDEKLPDLESFFSGLPVRDEVAVSVPSKEKADSDESSDSLMRSYSNGGDSNDGDGSSDSVSLRSLSELGDDSAQNVSPNQSESIAARQSAIVEKIKAANGSGCRLKDVLADFPNVSERTLRYDLQKLCDKGVVVRVGNGGPATYYRIA